MGVELDGTDRDLAFFSHAKELDLQEISKNSDVALVKKITENFAKLEKQGLVKTVSGKMKITPKGLETLGGKEFDSLHGKLFEKTLGAVPVGKIFVATKKILSAVTNVPRIKNAPQK